MKGQALRRHLLDDEIARLSRVGRVIDAEAGFRSILDRLTDKENLFTLTKSQKDRIAHRAARLALAAVTPPPSLRAALIKGSWRERGAAASTFARGGAAVRAIGSLRGADSASARRPHAAFDDLGVARTLATAIREIVTPGVAEAQARVAGDAASALRREDGGAQVWEKALSPLLREFVWNAESAGASRAAAALESLTAAAALTGRARQGSEDDLAFQLGSAAGTILRQETTPRPETKAAGRLAEDLAERNDARQRLWDGPDRDETRLLGAAAAFAAFGKGALRRRAGSFAAHASAGAMLQESWRERFALLTSTEAADELLRMAADPRLSDDGRAAAEFAAEAAAAHPGAAQVSFAEALGLDTPDVRREPMRSGRMFRAAPRGSSPARLLCRGKNGRLIRCRAVADARGALVGYLAFDPLSREYGGRPLFAAYGLDGRRQGYAWADEPMHWRAGAPEQGFVSAPESIPL